MNLQVGDSKKLNLSYLEIGENLFPAIIPEISNMILSCDTTVGLIDQRTSADFEELEVKSMMNSHKSRFHASMFMFS